VTGEVVVQILKVDRCRNSSPLEAVVEAMARYNLVAVEEEAVLAGHLDQKPPQETE